jgi:hypothetical protein
LECQILNDWSPEKLADIKVIGCRDVVRRLPINGSYMPLKEEYFKKRLVILDTSLRGKHFGHILQEDPSATT